MIVHSNHYKVFKPNLSSFIIQDRICNFLQRVVKEESSYYVYIYTNHYKHVMWGFPLQYLESKIAEKYKKEFYTIIADKIIFKKADVSTVENIAKYVKDFDKMVLKES